LQNGIDTPQQFLLGMCDNPAMSIPESPPNSRLTLAVEHSGDATVVRLSGKLVAGVTDILVSEVRRLIPDHKRIVLDLTDLVYMDSMGLGSIIRLYVSAKSAGTTLELINLSKRIRELLGVTNVLSVFEACGDAGARMR
jgi:anti-sigma B factor antagonist